MSDVTKRCACDAAKQPKCAHPWYMKKFIWQGTAHQHNVTRWALVHLREAVTTRTRADEVVEHVRTLIRAGSFTSAKAARAARPTADPAMTLAQLVEQFTRDILDGQIHDVDAATDETLDNHRSRLARLVDFDDFGARPARSFDASAFVAFRKSPTMRVQGRSSWAKHRGIYNRLFRFGKHAGVVDVNPFDVVSEEQHTVLRRRKGEARSRRLKVGEEDRLLRASLVGRFPFDAQRLHDLIVGAIESGARKGELLALQWGAIDLAAPPAVGIARITAVEKGAKKTRKPRMVPISLRWRAVLERRRVNPLTGQPFPDSAYVYGNEVGERVTQIKAWYPAVVRAEGQTPELERGNLSAASLVVYKAAALHFHDLRREGASRWLETGRYTLREIQELLGHSNIAQTSEYLGLQAGSLIDAARRNQAIDLREQREREALPLAVGANDYKATANADGPQTPTSRPRLVRGNKAREDSHL